MGDNEVFKTLNAWYGGKPRGTKTYVIKKFNSVAETAECNVLFIANQKSGEFENVLAKTNGKRTLSITDKNGLGARGSVINFQKTNDKLKFELNPKSCRECKPEGVWYALRNGNSDLGLVDP